MQHRTFRVAALLGASALIAPACTTLLGDFSVGTGTTGTGGSGGSTSTITAIATGTGGASTTTTGTGGASTTTTGTGTGIGGGGGGGGTVCTTSAECVAFETACSEGQCGGEGYCISVPRPADTVLGAQVKGDCKVTMCDGLGNIVIKNDPLDFEDDKNPCTADACVGPANSHAAVPPGTACTLENNPAAKVCALGALCVECIAATDCASMSCQQGKCVAASCMNQQKDGSETGTDCGGGVCSACPPGAGCLASTDCQSLHCEISTLLCVAATCTDGIKNQGEANTDCGGPACPGCPNGSPCIINFDCFSGVCSGNVCVDLCNDGLQDGSESDVDCGGGICAGCDSGKSCTNELDCASKVCKPGFVCE